MDQNILRPDLLPPTVPPVAVWIIAVVSLTLWVLFHRYCVRRFPDVRKRLAMLVPVGTVGCWGLFQLMGRYLYLSTRWHILFCAFVASLSFELVAWLYRREFMLVPRKGLRRAIVAMRMLSICVVLFVLLQPVLVGEKARVIRRRVVVLLDDSASMHFRDRYWKDEEKLDLGLAFGMFGGEGEDNALGGFGAKLVSYASQISELSAVAETGAGALVPRVEELRTLAEEGDKDFQAFGDALSNLAQTLDRNSHPSEVVELPRLAAYAKESIAPVFRALGDSVKGDKQPANSTVDTLRRLGDGVARLASRSEMVENSVTACIYDKLSDAVRADLAKMVDTSRSAIARKLLTDPLIDGSSAIDTMRKDYDVSFYRFGSASEPVSGVDAVDSSTTGAATEVAAEDPGSAGESPEEHAFRSSTDFTRVLERVLVDIPVEEIAGFLVVTDGRHNGDAGVDAVSRRLGGANIPVNTLIIGGSRPPVDVAVAEANAPESVFLGDKIRVSGSISASGSRGKEAHIRLFRGKEQIDEKLVYVESDDFMSEFRFVDIPEEMGVYNYRVAVDAMEGEEFPSNNDWDLDVSVTDDRTNVLLVDDRPRWEFRYLRNLFYGRDKSVHLQEYLVHPDTLASSTPRAPLPPASASRKFGDSESGAFPVNRAEWTKFDVIILGDIGDDVLTPAVAEEIAYCVEQRGALLVLIDGPRAFPHAVHSETMNRLMPVESAKSFDTDMASAEESFRLRLAPSGRTHPAMRQSTSSYENEQIWNDLPEFYWRHPVSGIKPGAEVLAYAESADVLSPESAASQAASTMAKNPEAAVQLLAEMRKSQEEHALIVTRNQGRGRVMQLTTDSTWRLRYRVGDTRHHQFWGQVLRWGAGEKLRAGNQHVRLGTDQLRYTPSEKILIQARVQDAEFNAINDLSPKVTVFDANGRELRTLRLRYREDSNGFYEAELSSIDLPGVYHVALSCKEGERILGNDWPENLSTRFVVVTSRRPAEYVNVSSSREVPRKMAQASGGVVCMPSHLKDAISGFGEGNRIMRERTELYLWDRGPVFLLLILLLTLEWIYRKKAGLS